MSLGRTVRALVCIFVDALAESFHSAVLDLFSISSRSSVSEVILCAIASRLLLDCSVCLLALRLDLSDSLRFFVCFILRTHHLVIQADVS